MITIIVKHLRTHLLLIVLLTGLTIRIINPFFGSPVLHVVGDEVSNYTSALNMISQKTFISLTSQYPPLGSYIQIPFLFIAYLFMLITQKVSSQSEFIFYLATHEGFLLFIPRIISAIFGSLSILTVYLTTKELYPSKKHLAYWSSFLFAFSLTNIQLSHLAKPWAPSLFFYLLSLLFLLKGVKNNRNNYILLSAFCISISFGFLQIAFYAFLLYLLVILTYYKSKPFLSKTNKIYILGALIIVLSSLITVNLIKYKPTADFLFKFNSWNGFLFFTKQLLTNETALIILSVPTFLNKQYWKKPFLGISIYITLYFIICGLFFYNTSRYLLPIIIMLPFYAVYTINLIKSRFLLFFIILIAIYPAISWISIFIREPTFVMASKWIDEEIPPDILIASNTVRFNKFVPANNSIEIIQKYNPTDYQILKSYLTDNFYPENVRNIIYLDRFGITNKEVILNFTEKYDVKYLVDIYWDPKTRKIGSSNNMTLVKRFFPTVNNKNIYISNLYDTLVSPNALELIFYIERPGPYIDILELKK